MTEKGTKELPQGLKLALDFVPLVAFFIAYKLAGFYWATAVIIALTILSLVIGYALNGRVAKFPLFSGILITVMGGLTLYLQNDVFVKMKPTAANLVFAGILGGGLLADRMFLKDLLGSAIEMPQAAWRRLTIRWTIFFIFLAVVNEYVWRTMSDDAWVSFKVFGLLGLTIFFAVANAPFMAKHMKSDEANPSADG